MMIMSRCLLFLFFVPVQLDFYLNWLCSQVTKLKVSINVTIANGTRAVNEIYKNHRRQDLIQQTDRSFDVAAEVLVVSNIGSTQLHEHSDKLPLWVNCYKEFIHYRYVCVMVYQQSSMVCLCNYG